jgi:hypothetical protein
MADPAHPPRMHYPHRLTIARVRLSMRPRLNYRRRSEAGRAFVCVSERTPFRGVNNSKKPSTIAKAKMPTIVEIDAFGLRPHIAISSRSSFIESSKIRQCSVQFLDVYGSSWRSVCVPFFRLSTRRVSLGNLIISSLHLVKQKQDGRGHAQEHEMEVNTSICGPGNSRAKECHG